MESIQLHKRDKRGIKEKGRASKTEKTAQPQICICKWAPTATTVLKAISPLILYKGSVFPQPTENKTKQKMIQFRSKYMC